MIAEELERNIHFARADARRRGLEFVTIEHLVLALLDNSQVREILARGADAQGLRRALESFIQTRVPKRQTPGDAPPTEGFKRVIRRAVSPPESPNLPLRRRRRDGRPVPVNGLHVLAAVYAERDSIASYYLQKHGVERLGIIAHLANEPADSPSPAAAIPPYPTHPAHPNPSYPSQPHSHPHAQPQTQPHPRAPGIRPVPPSRPRDLELSAAAAAGLLESPFGREKEIAQAARALARKYKNNPLLVGEPGVGKTAVVHALAHRIARGDIPPALAGMKIFAVSVSDLVAGAKYRGDFEQRMRDLLEKCRAAGNAAIFIDEIHTVIGAGAASGGALDAANILKPALAAGGVRCIGATTFAEFRRVFEKDAALARRFQTINIAEPESAELRVILDGVVARLEAHHGVSYAPDAASAAADLSRRWMPNKFLPDKAIDILDDAGAHRRMSDRRNDFRPVDPRDLERAAARLTGRTAEIVSRGEARRLAGLEKRLSARVLDQPEAMRRLAGAVLRARLGYAEKRRAAGAFLFTGPTGVGKTETARRLAEILGVPLLRHDMSEYMERHAASRLIGAPPGYVGFDQGGRLTEEISRHPGAVALFDEAEKAHPDVLNLLLQVMDYGALTDGGGRRADFSGATIILTSNAGAAEWERAPAGFGRGEAGDVRAGDEAVSRMFSPEFRNRLDAIVRFHPLEARTIGRILSARLSALAAEMRERKGVEIVFGRRLREGLRRDGFSPTMGARPLEKLIRERALESLARAEAEGVLVAGGRFHLDADGAGEGGATVRRTGLVGG